MQIVDDVLSLLSTDMLYQILPVFPHLVDRCLVFVVEHVFVKVGTETFRQNSFCA